MLRRFLRETGEFRTAFLHLAAHVSCRIPGDSRLECLCDRVLQGRTGPAYIATYPASAARLA